MKQFNGFFIMQKDYFSAKIKLCFIFSVKKTLFDDS